MCDPIRERKAMTYDKHIFISYSHLDNQPLTAEQEGWVSRFHESLQKILSMRMGRSAKIWRDKKLCGNDCFADEIVAQFPMTEILICVLSQCYVESEWCQREVQEFCRRAGEIRVGNKYRVVKVIKLPPDNAGPLPAFLKDMLGYNFFTYQDPEQAKNPLELDPLYFPNLTPLYITQLCKMADDVIEVIRKLESSSADSEHVPQIATLAPPVFLAQCSWDRREARDALEMELRPHGYPILPDHQLPTEETDFVAEVSRLLAQSKLAVHMVGGFPGFVPDGPSRKPAQVLQNELAIALAKKNGLRRVIWLPQGTVSQDPEQNRFIEALQTDAEAQFGAELISGDLEALKTAVYRALQNIERPAPQIICDADDSEGQLIYLICDAKDRESVLPLRKLLRSKGFETKIPLFEGDAASIDRAKQEMLTQCQTALVFYGKGDEAWKHAIDSDLQKSRGYRAGKDQLIKFTYLSEPTTTEKTEMIELGQPNLVSGLGGFSETTANALVEMLQARVRRAA
jgi:TIR domain